jgi:cell division protein FtsZ
MPDALKKADEVLQQAVQGITDLINLPALINLDFADVSTVMKDKGMAHIGIGSAKGDDKAVEAVKLAVASPLLETTINGASHVIINISGDISLMDANDAASYVQELAGDDANIIFGAKYDETMVDEATITVIATGLDVGAKPMTSMPGMLYAQNQRPVAAPVYTTRTVNSGSTQPVAPTRPVTQAAPTSQAPQAANPTLTSGIQKPRQPESSVKPVEISIPDFLKNSRR